MIGALRVLGLVPARGGSKGIPRKNLRAVAGKSLLQWTAEAASSSRYLDRVVLSTDDEEIAEHGRAVGLDVPFRRPAELATDSAPAAEVIVHCLDELGDGFDVLVYLQPSSPLRLAEDIDGCVELVAAGHDLVVSVHPVAERPELMFALGPGGELRPLLGRRSEARRQELGSWFVLNGAVYAARIAAYQSQATFLTPATVGYPMPRERGVDIDEETDLWLAEALLVRADAEPGSRAPQ